LRFKDQGHGERKCINRFNAYLRKKWIDLRENKIRMISCPFYTYRQIHFTNENASCCDDNNQ